MEIGVNYWRYLNSVSLLYVKMSGNVNYDYYCSMFMYMVIIKLFDIKEMKRTIYLRLIIKIYNLNCPRHD